MRILVNATNLRIGGGVQRAVEFVRASVAYDRDHEYHYALSDVVARNLAGVADLHGQRILIAEASPARPLAGRGTIRALHGLEEQVRPDVVFSIFGPTYTRFRSPHLMGFAVPWVTHPNPHAWRSLRSPLTRAWYRAWILRAVHSTRRADRWVLETAVAADGLARALGVDRDHCHVVPNVCGEHYFRAARDGVEADGRLAKARASDFDLLVFSAWYPHKRLELVPRVAAELRRRDPSRRYRFFLTIDAASAPWARIRREARARGVAAEVVNLGPIPVADGPGLYQAADALFLPTVLESFTASYLEAMCMKRPIVTTDLPFAREVCGDAALCFPPDDVAAAAAAITHLASEERLAQELVRKGSRRLEDFPGPREIYGMIVDLLEATARVSPGPQNGAPRV